jgi:deoxycytidine triphosphate deaminase
MSELLSGQKLLDILRESDRIFSRDSWSQAQLKGSGYDLRLASDLLVIPPRPGDPGHKRFGRGQSKSSFTLAPGDSAVISTKEECTFDWNISAIIGPKFGLASKGLLVLQGMAAHPGYGRERTEDGEWAPKEHGERLFFIIVNVGPDYVTLQEGQDIAFLQIFEVEPPVEKKFVKNVGIEGLSDLFRTDDTSAYGGLRYFRMVKDVDEKVDTIKADVDYAKNAVNQVSNTSNMIVVFGVFLVSTTVLGFTLAILVNLIEKFSFQVGTVRGILSVALMVLYGLSTLISVVLVNSAVQKVISKEPAKHAPSETEAAKPAAPKST